MKIIVATYYNKAEKKLGILITHGKAFSDLKLDEKKLLGQAKLQVVSAKKANLADFDSKLAEIKVKDFEYANTIHINFKEEDYPSSVGLQTYLLELDKFVKSILDDIKQAYPDVQSVIYDGDINLTFPSKAIFPNFLLDNSIHSIFKDSEVTVNAYSSLQPVVNAAIKFAKAYRAVITPYNPSSPRVNTIRSTQSEAWDALEDDMRKLSIIRANSCNGNLLFSSQDEHVDGKEEVPDNNFKSNG
ncbi:Uncharacterised protein [Legionella busanensis]|uniref:Uncharacterized protein n=1 Tax=Legionella busanensis TaxID=190655 RepID=A0A378JV98_9GAMM|nr:hypothetical protein [Legionella busanensis]STX52132.1 Uncharacterised protein [Legionella busanensis]